MTDMTNTTDTAAALANALDLRSRDVRAVTLPCGDYLAVDDGPYCYLVDAQDAARWMDDDDTPDTSGDIYSHFVQTVDHVEDNDVIAAAAELLGFRLHGWDGDLDTQSP